MERWTRRELDARRDFLREFRDRVYPIYARSGISDFAVALQVELGLLANAALEEMLTAPESPLEPWQLGAENDDDDDEVTGA